MFTLYSFLTFGLAYNSFIKTEYKSLGVEAKKKKMREILKRDMAKFPIDLPLMHRPDILVSGLVAEECSIFASAI